MKALPFLLLLLPLAAQNFELTAGLASAQVWGRGAENPRIYFPEQLPALFSRTIEIKEPLPPGATIEWIFTGDQGGVTVALSGLTLTLRQRYYDSYGFSPNRGPWPRHPEKTFDETAATLAAPPHSLTLEVDHRLALILKADGKEAARQATLLDLRRHQLSWKTPESFRGKLAVRLVSPSDAEATLTVNTANRRQSILGFGGIASIPAYVSLSGEGKRLWWKYLAEYNLLLQREYPNGNRLREDLSNFDTLADATPHYYGDNFPNGEITGFDYIRQVRRLGGKVLFEFWDLPPWARKPGTREPIIPAYVRAVVGFCRAARERSGAPPEIVGIQNEVVQPPEVWQQMALALRKGLDEAGFQSVRIHMADMGTLEGGLKAARAFTASAEAWRAIDFAASHVYDYQKFFEDPDGFDATIRAWRDVVGSKPFISTEFTINSSRWQSSSYRAAFAMAQLYHKNLALLDAQALLYCWTILDIEQPSYGATRSLFTVDRSRSNIPVPSGYQLRAFGAFSRRLREGMVRLDAASSSPDLLATAYEGPNGSRTVILLNRGLSPLRIRLAWPGASFRSSETASPWLENASTPLSPNQPIDLQPGEIRTLFTRQ